jgi:hypothetical protein
MKAIRDKDSRRVVVYHDDGTVALVTTNSKIARDFIEHNVIRAGNDTSSGK